MLKKQASTVMNRIRPSTIHTGCLCSLFNVQLQIGLPATDGTSGRPKYISEWAEISSYNLPFTDRNKPLWIAALRLKIRSSTVQLYSCINLVWFEPICCAFCSRVTPMYFEIRWPQVVPQPPLNLQTQWHHLKAIHHYRKRSFSQRCLKTTRLNLNYSVEE